MLEPCTQPGFLSPIRGKLKRKRPAGSELGEVPDADMLFRELLPEALEESDRLQIID